MEIRKITLNELRTLVKHIIKEEISDNREKYDMSINDFKGRKEDFEKQFPTLNDKIKFLSTNTFPKEWFDNLPYDLKKQITYKNFTIYRFNSLNNDDKIKLAFSDYGLNNIKGIIGNLPNDYNRKFNRFIGKNRISVGDDIMRLWSENDKIEYFLEFLKYADKAGVESYGGNYKLRDYDFTIPFQSLSEKSKEIVLKLTDNEYLKKLIADIQENDVEQERIEKLKIKRKETGVKGLPKVDYGSGTYAYYDKETDTYYDNFGGELKNPKAWRKEKSDLDNLFGGGGDYFDDDDDERN